MRLSLIGMAGSGKSFWSRKLEIQGFRRFCCDDMIAERLLSELKNPDGTPMSVADWMGFPYEARYREREARYLSLEAEVLGDLVDYLESGKEALQENIIVDTTGSVIYMADNDGPALDAFRCPGAAAGGLYFPTTPHGVERHVLTEARRVAPGSPGPVLPRSICLAGRVVPRTRSCVTPIRRFMAARFWDRGIPGVDCLGCQKFT